MSRYFKICKSYFKLGADNKKYLILLFITAILRCLTFAITPIFAAKIIDYATLGLYKDTFTSIILLAINYLIYLICHHLNFIVYAKNTDYVYNKLHSIIATKVAHYDEDFTKRLPKSYLDNTVTNDVMNVCMFTDRMIDALAHVVTDMMSIFILLFYNLEIGLIVLVFNMIYQIMLAKGQKKKDYYFMGQRRNQDRITSLYEQMLDASREIKAFDMKEKLNNYLDIYKRSWTKQYFLKRKYWDLSKVIYPVIITISKFIAYIIAIHHIMNGTMTVGDLVLIITYIDQIERENFDFFEKVNKVCDSSVRIDRLSKVINYHNKNMLEFGNNLEDNIGGDIIFDKVTFKYENNISLDKVSFEIEPNKITAIVGESGSGKSTIFRLLLRLYKINSGHIYIDGIDIYDYGSKVYPSNISIATQKPFIFNMSIKDNLSLVDKNTSNQINACKRVGIHDFIMSLPKGYNTILSEDATNISGGQKQLISMARTLLSKAEILLFDEVTSALDPNTTKHIIKVSKDLKKDHTVVIITHKSDLMKAADNLIVIDKGKVKGIGKHKKLLVENRYYQRLFK
ncbi:MAG TPA: ABC transporter ATP-binding protein [Candidatus Faecimonas gallistercoris]|nr:ABC transporter ATP-binding protein [Candidatus Faecimonas gallistercoris]